MLYTIADHKHRYAAWAASRAANTKTCRFTVQHGKNILEAVGLRTYLADPNLLPDPASIDAQHRAWRMTAIDAADSTKLMGFRHGVAAKLINVYLKGAIVCAGHESHPHVAALHPPIDSLLLQALYQKNIGGLRTQWDVARKQRWSKFTSQEYEDVIMAIRTVMAGRPLWEIEAYWRGYQ